MNYICFNLSVDETFLYSFPVLGLNSFFFFYNYRRFNEANMRSVLIFMYSVQALSIEYKLIFLLNPYTRLARFIKMIDFFMIE